MPHQFLAVDIGTSSSKGVIIDKKGRILADKSIPHKNFSKFQGNHEQDPRVWWDEFVNLVSSLTTTLKKERIRCICISGIWPTFCPADADGNPLYNSILYNDTRCIDLIQSSELYKGSVKYGYEYPPKIAWFRKNLPHVWEKTRKIFTTHNFLIHQLTGTYCLDGHTANVLGGIFDPEAFDWDSKTLSLFDIPRELLPQVFSPSAIVGNITKKAAMATGLKSGTPVITGAGDTFVSVVGSGANRPGDLTIYFGTLGMLIRLTENVSYLVDADQYLGNNEGVNWLLGLTDSGKQLAWGANLFKNKMKDDLKVDWEDFESIALNSSPGANGVIFNHNNDLSQDFNITFTPKASIVGLSINNTQADISRAIYESFGYALRRAIENTAIYSKGKKRMFAAGGGAASTLWRQIVADILQAPILYSPRSTGCYGGALIAGHAVGEINIDALLNDQISHSHTSFPNDKNFQIYNTNYERFLELSKTSLSFG